jgi:type VI secretion system secreted protein VgrG
MTFTQENRIISLETPLGADTLLLQGFTGSEGISRMFRFHLDLLSENRSIAFGNIIGKQVTVKISLAGSNERYFNGYVSRFAQSGSDVRFAHYQMEVVPWLWFLTRNADCRIFQNLTIPDIIQQVFKDRGFTDFKNSLTGSFEPREYCVQYRETDFNFVSRLMEQYGIFYYFEHNENKHTLVLGNSPTAHQACPGQPKARYNTTIGYWDDEDVITGWHMEQELRTGKYSLTDYNFETPSTSLLSSDPTVFSVDGNNAFEIYDYPGIYLTKSQGDNLTKIRMQEEEAPHVVVTGASVCRAFTSGYKFTLSEHYRNDMNQDYLLTEVQHMASVGNSYTFADTERGETYSNQFTCIAASVPFRPPRVTPKPFVQGPQPALVVGKSGEEIWVDKYGRVVVQFYWDRVGKDNEKSSCWVRVSQPWAGKNWGAMWIPRIGQEVLVSFLEGDPDRPLITGRVYNAEQMPPYTLPDHQTVSTFMSRSSKNGGTGNYNEIRFEDKKGDEQIFMNAEKDMDLRVEKDSREYVGANRHLIVKTNQQELVEGDKSGHVKGNHLEKIDGDMSLTVSGDQSEKVGGGYSFQVGQSIDEKVGMKRATEAGQEIHLKAGMKVIIEAGLQVTLKGPGGFVDVGPTGVTIQGTMVLINSGGASGSGSGASPKDPKDPKDPDQADDGSKFGKM